MQAIEQTLPQRLARLWDHLGLGAAHVAAQMPGDLAGFIASAPERVAGLVLCVPSRLDPAPFAGVSGRLLLISGEGDLTDAVTGRALPRLPGAQRQVLQGYAAPGWADVVADRTEPITGWMIGHLRRFAADPPHRAGGALGTGSDTDGGTGSSIADSTGSGCNAGNGCNTSTSGGCNTDSGGSAARGTSSNTEGGTSSSSGSNTGTGSVAGIRTGAEGVVAGITYRIQGAGPALVLLPFFLAPSQWDKAIPALARHFSVVTLGGRHIGGIAALEDRAHAPSYRAMVRSLLEHMAPQPGEAILDIGSGSGALDRMVARRWPANPITAVDVNPFLQREAMALAAEEGLHAAIAFRPGSAEALPFPDASFDCVFTVTVLEECDADRALREAWRVLRPGGRLGVIVRAIDLPQWWNLDLPPALRARAETPPQSCGARGVADASLYRRMRAAGFAGPVCSPSLVTLDRPDGPIWRYREDHLLSLLTPEETATWHALTNAARHDGVLLMAHPMHCAVGIKPHASPS